MWLKYSNKVEDLWISRKILHYVERFFVLREKIFHCEDVWC